MGIKHLRIPIDPELQVIAGQNNAGKTTLLKAIEFFFDSTRFAADEVRPKNEYYATENKGGYTRVRLTFSALTAAEDQALGRHLGRRGSFWVEVRLKKSSSTREVLAKDKPASEEVYARVQQAFNLVHVPAVRVHTGATGQGDHQRLAATMRDVLVRSRGGRRTDVQKKFEKLGHDLEGVVLGVLDESKGHLQEDLVPAADLQFRMPGLGALLDAIIMGLQLQTRSGTDLLLQDEGTGFQSLLSMGVLRFAGEQSAARGTTSLFLLEEPEAFLHPHHQRAVAARLRELAKSAQVLVTTHSPTIADSVDIRSICRLPRHPEGLDLQWKPEPLEEAQAGRLNTHCDAKNSELIFADSVVFCEGQADEGVISSLIERVARRPSEMGISIVAMGSRDKAEHFVHLAKRFSVPYVVVLDKDAYKPGDMKTLSKLFQAASSSFDSTIRRTLQDLWARACTGPKQAADVRDEANATLDAANVFCLGSDVEMAVMCSFSLRALRGYLGESGVSAISEADWDDIASQSSEKRYERLRELAGSKGWNNAHRAGGKTLKPHVFGATVRNVHGQLVETGDLAALYRYLDERDFIK